MYERVFVGVFYFFRVWLYATVQRYSNTNTSRMSGFTGSYGCCGSLSHTHLHPPPIISLRKCEWPVTTSAPLLSTPTIKTVTCPPAFYRTVNRMSNLVAVGLSAPRKAASLELAAPVGFNEVPISILMRESGESWQAFLRGSGGGKKYIYIYLLHQCGKHPAKNNRG